MFTWLFDEQLKKLFNKLDLSKLYEIRLRRNCPIVINYNGKNVHLLTEGLFQGEKVYVNTQIIEKILRRATENSLYAYNNQLKQGYITAKGGVRIGVAGETVPSENLLPVTIKNVNSLNIRIPHEVSGCSKHIFKFIYSLDTGIKNTLIISPPGAGKTTILRDIACKLTTDVNRIYNVLIVDERFEIAACVDGDAKLNVGYNTDIISGSTKKFGFSNGVRVLKPDVIITDELMNEDDSQACINAINSGVKVIASIHAKNHIEVLNKKSFSMLIKDRYFERIIVLSNEKGPGTCEMIYDQELKCIYF